MPKITINGRELEFTKGQTILQVALDNGIDIPHYCYHPGLSIVANCRICLGEVFAPNPKTGAMEAIPKHTTNTRRRSTRSATCPAGRAKTASGKN